MTTESAQERTEQPTAKRRREARERGQIPRSRELNTTLILLSSAVFLYAYMPVLGTGLLGLMEQGLAPDARHLSNHSAMLEQLGIALWRALILLLPFFATLVLVSVLAPSLLGGWLLSPKNLKPKWERLDPLKGLKRIFSIQGLVELAKAVSKLLVIATVGAGYLWHRQDDIIGRPAASISSDVFAALDLFGSFFMVLAASTLLIALVDVPFQIWSHTRKLRMTRQEVKDEMKETEGRPEVKMRVRALQREMAKQRMMEAVPKADVVVTNPTHFAVALRYEPLTGNAPRVVAKGVELVARRIRLTAEANNVAVFEAPPLARALFHSTKIGQEIPDALYLAVAQVLAYVYQLKSVRERGGDEPPPPVDLAVPEGFTP